MDRREMAQRMGMGFLFGSVCAWLAFGRFGATNLTYLTNGPPIKPGNAFASLSAVGLLALYTVGTFMGGLLLGYYLRPRQPWLRSVASYLGFLSLIVMAIVLLKFIPAISQTGLMPE
jgi:hypothetical protein